MSARGLALVVALACLACNRTEPPRKLEPRARREPAPLPPARDLEAVAASRERVAGPAADASPEQRRAAVLALLTDGSTADHLPLAAE